MFRFKIALLSVLLSGTVIVGLGYYSLRVMNRVGLDRIDREILSLGEGHLAVGPPREYWQNFERSLRIIYRVEQAEHLVVQVKDPRNEILYKSPQWPAEITEDNFPGFDRSMDVRPAGEGVMREEGGAIVKTVAFERPPAGGGGPRQGRRGPPPEAYQACQGRSAGSRSSFVDPRGETIVGTCEEADGTLVLRPDRNRIERPRLEAEQGGVHPPAEEPRRQERQLPRIKKPVLATFATQSGDWRVGIMGSERITMMVGVNLAAYHEDANRYRMAFLATVPFALLLLAGGGWLIAARALRPVALITRTAEGITARALDQRVPLVDADRELARLVEVINGMLDRLEKGFGQAVRFSADAAHELQTPLAILQGELDEAVQHAAVGSEEQRRASGLLEEVQRLKSIVQKLLVLARADAGRLDLRLEEVDLSALVESAAEDAGALAPHLRIEKKIAPAIVVKADADLLSQAISNLTTNAVKYNVAHGSISFDLSVRSARAVLVISNSGAPIPAEDRERIFDRFYRVDRSRSRAIGGSGLGLSLAREIVVAHRGDLRLRPATGNMVSFMLTLPCSSA